MQVEVRPLTEADVDAAREVQTAAFNELDRKLGEPALPVTSAVVERQRRRVRHFLAHDPGGSWVATADGCVVGVALASLREGLWGLSLFVVAPGRQGLGIGRPLLDASLRYAAGATAAVIMSSPDPRAMRRYAVAGFDLHPQVRARGHVDRSTLPPGDPHVRPGTIEDVEFANAVDRDVRGAARGPDHTFFIEQGSMWVFDNGGRRGYAYMRGDSVQTVVATDDHVAAQLLWACFAAAEDRETEVGHVNGGQQWAFRVAVAAGLALAPVGPAFWRGRTPPPAYVPSGIFL